MSRQIRLCGSLGQLSRTTYRPWQRRKASTEAAVIEEGPEPLNGFLFNEKPLLPGEKRVKEWWENLWVYGMGFNMLLLIGVGTFKPDTSVSSWAREQAKERLSAAEESAIALTMPPSDSDDSSDDS